MNRIVVYTAIFINYDWLKDPVHMPAGIDFICYTDSDNLVSSKWIIKRVSTDGKTPSLLNREIKILYPYTELSHYDYSLYIDGSIMIKQDINKFIFKYISTDLVLMNFQHPNNDCIFEEMKRCIQQKRGNPDKLLEQYRIYRNDGMPFHYGLSDNKVLLRNNKSLIGANIMKEWYSHVVNYSGRDQVCLSYVLYKNNRRYSFFLEDIDNNAFLETWPHNVDPWYIIYWRHFKWFCERHHCFLSIVKFIESRIKPLFINNKNE